MYKAASFYKFFDCSEIDLEVRKSQILDTAKEHNVLGLFIIAKEGINSTFAGAPSDVETFKHYIMGLYGEDILFKYSESSVHPFKKLIVKIRDEIVTTDKKLVDFDHNKNTYLSPKEWHEVLKNEDVQIIDTRNTYETKIGSFKNAVKLKMRHFKDFRDILNEEDLDKNKKTLIFCTGGIRCEKGEKIVREVGFKEVYQLDGGILKYMEEFPDGFFEGECFVFDNRVALDKNLEPTKQYTIDYRSGDPVDLVE